MLDPTTLSDSELERIAAQPDSPKPAASVPAAPLGSEMTDAQLAQIANSDKPAEPTVDDVMSGLTPAASSAIIANSAHWPEAVAQHKSFMARADEDPYKTGNFDLQYWRQMTGRAPAPGFWASVGAGIKGTAIGAAALAEQVDEIGMRHGGGDDIAATRQMADLALVSGAKALSFNNSIPRAVATWTHKAITAVQKIGLTPQEQSELDYDHQKFAFEQAVKNRADDDTAASIHKDIITTIQSDPYKLKPKPITAAAATVFGNTEVDQDASNFASMLPQMATESLFVSRFTLASAGTEAAKYGSLITSHEAAREGLAALRSAQADAQTAVAAALKTAGREGSGEAISDASIAQRTAAQNVAAKESQLAGLAAQLPAARTAALDEATKVSQARDILGTAAGKAGSAASWTARQISRVQAIPEAIGKRLAPESELAQRSIAGVVEGAGGYALDKTFGNDDSGAGGALLGGTLGFGLGRVGVHALENGARDITKLGQIYAAGEATLPFWRNVRMAEGVSGLTKQGAAFMDSSAVRFTGVDRLIPAATKGAVAAGTFGAGLGALTNPEDPASGAAAGLGGGAVLGITMGAFGQWRSYDSPAQIMRERAGQERVYAQSLAARPTEQAAYNKLSLGDRQSIAGRTLARPDLRIRYIDDPSQRPASFDPKIPNEVTLNVASADPLHELLGHEIGHFVAEHELGSTIARQYLGDADAGIPGEYTARDAEGNPIVVTDAAGKKSYQMNADFQKIQDAYLTRMRTTLEAKGGAWTPERIDTELQRFKNPSYVANEIFAEQHLAYLSSKDFTYDVKGMTRAKDVPAINDLVGNSAFLKQALGLFGVDFTPDGDVIHSPILGDIKKSATVDSLIREYTQRQARGKSGDMEFTGGDTRIDETALTKETGYAERYFEASGEILRDNKGNPIYDANGKVVLRPKNVVEKDARDVGIAVRTVLDKLATSGATQHPDAVQKRTTIDGRTVYAGRWLPDEAVDAIVKSGKWNAAQIDHLLQVNADLKQALGGEWNHFYQAALSKATGNKYRSLSGRWRSDLAHGWQVSAGNNLLVMSASMQTLMDNASRAVSRGDARLWNNDLGALVSDIRTYLGNVTSGQHGETGLGSGEVGVDKKNFIQNLTGLRVKAYGDVNELHGTTNPPKVVLTSLRIDRINQLNRIGDRNVPWSSKTTELVSKNYSPDRDGRPASEEVAPEEPTNPPTDQSANPDIRYTPGSKIGVAPLRETQVSGFNEADLKSVDKPLANLESTLSSAAKLLGVRVSANRVVGGWQDTETGKVVREGSLIVTIHDDLSHDRLAALAAHLGENAPERQNGVMIFDPGEGSDIEHAITLKGEDAAADITSKLKDFDLGAGFSFDPETKTLYILTTKDDTNVSKLIDYAKAKNLYGGHSSRSGTVAFPSSDQYAGLIAQGEGGGPNLPPPDGGKR